MGTVKMDTAAVRTLVDRALESADRLDEIRWPTMASDAMAGSSVAMATASPSAEDHLAGVVAHLRAWVTAVRASTAVIEQAELRHADRLAEPR